MNKRDKELAIEAGIYTNQSKTLQKFADLIRADEREACAKVCEDDWGTTAEKDAGMMFAAAIRARGEQ